MARGYSNLRVLVAWAKSSGLSRIADAVRAHHAAGGRSEIVVGIDAQGGTWEGLELAMGLFNDAYIFHDSGAPTFHPKVYLLEATATATAWVGSGNLTRGGLYTNYEATLVVELDLSVPADEKIRTQINDYIDWFTSHPHACKRLTAGLLDDLRADPRELIQSERERTRRASSHRSRVPATLSIFGPPVTGLSGAPPAGSGAIAGDDEDLDSRIPVIGPTASSRRRAARRGAISRRVAMSAGSSFGFFKRLASNDVSTGSSPGQIIIPIRFLDFFPELATEKDETASGGPRQLARELAVRFIDGGWEKTAFGRIIYYEPASSHPRQNIDLRFTFRDREILRRLSAGDYLVFDQDDFGLVVTRRPPGSFSERFGWL